MESIANSSSEKEIDLSPLEQIFACDPFAIDIAKKIDLYLNKLPQQIYFNFNHKLYSHKQITDIVNTNVSFWYSQCQEKMKALQKYISITDINQIIAHFCGFYIKNPNFYKASILNTLLNAIEKLKHNLTNDYNETYITIVNRKILHQSRYISQIFEINKEFENDFYGATSKEWNKVMKRAKEIYTCNVLNSLSKCTLCLRGLDLLPDFNKPKHKKFDN